MAATEGFEGAFVTEVIGDEFRINTGLPRLIESAEPPIVKKVVRRAELLKAHRHGFRFQACS